MDCQDVRDLLSDYLEEELPAAQSAAVRAHLEACKECRGELADLRATIGLIHSLPRQEPVFDLWEDFAPTFAAIRVEMEQNPQTAKPECSLRFLDRLARGWLMFGTVLHYHYTAGLPS